MTELNSPAPRKRRSAARIAAVVTGALASLIAVGLVGLGSVALWADG